MVAATVTLTPSWANEVALPAAAGGALAVSLAGTETVTETAPSPWLKPVLAAAASAVALAVAFPPSYEKAVALAPSAGGVVVVALAVAFPSCESLDGLAAGGVVVVALAAAVAFPPSKAFILMRLSRVIALADEARRRAMTGVNFILRRCVWV